MPLLVGQAIGGPSIVNVVLQHLVSHSQPCHGWQAIGGLQSDAHSVIIYIIYIYKDL